MNGLATIATTFGKPFNILFPSTFRKMMASMASTPQTRVPIGLELATCAGDLSRLRCGKFLATLVVLLVVVNDFVS